MLTEYDPSGSDQATVHHYSLHHTNQHQQQTQGQSLGSYQDANSHFRTASSLYTMPIDSTSPLPCNLDNSQQHLTSSSHVSAAAAAAAAHAFYSGAAIDFGQWGTPSNTPVLHYNTSGSGVVPPYNSATQLRHSSGAYSPVSRHHSNSATGVNLGCHSGSQFAPTNVFHPMHHATTFMSSSIGINPSASQHFHQQQGSLGIGLDIMDSKEGISAAALSSFDQHNATSSLINRHHHDLSNIPSSHQHRHSSFHARSLTGASIMEPPDIKPKRPHIKKPLNAFMLFMKEMRAKVVAECTLKESAAINQILGRKWHALSRDDQSKYYEMARKEKELHMQLYPGWSARDNYAIHSKRKKKRKNTINSSSIMSEVSGRESSNGSILDIANAKKCITRYAVEHQNQWCKPCGYNFANTSPIPESRLVGMFGHNAVVNPYEHLNVHHAPFHHHHGTSTSLLQQGGPSSVNSTMPSFLYHHSSNYNHQQSSCEPNNNSIISTSLHISSANSSNNVNNITNNNSLNNSHFSTPSSVSLHRQLQMYQRQQQQQQASAAITGSHQNCRDQQNLEVSSRQFVGMDEAVGNGCNGNVSNVTVNGGNLGLSSLSSN